MKQSDNNTRIPVVDIFAGPGGLGEGFARFPYQHPDAPRFQIRLSIEKDCRAHETLKLRSFKRQFLPRTVPGLFYQLLRQPARSLPDRLQELYDTYPEASRVAHDEALCAELGNPKFQTQIDSAVSRAVGTTKHWVLLGGPPCQAYSLVGRARNRGNADYVPSQDKRQFLYQDYLKVIADQLPSIFVMENVKGLLSATLKNEKIFERIISDLQEPRKSLGTTKRKPAGVKTKYRLFALEKNELLARTELADFVIQMEDYGVPQARHRLIILGVREDIDLRKLPSTLNKKNPIDVISVLNDLPRLRSGLSKEIDSGHAWKKKVVSATKSDWYRSLTNGRRDVQRLIREAIENMNRNDLDRRSEWIKSGKQCRTLRDWYRDEKLQGVLNHETRGHITDDLHRYLFAACYAKAVGVSPCLKDFPKDLLPHHRNVEQALNGSLFADRFRVQMSDRPSTTITSHISKDGHYYIHPDPSQCRSFTVREAARLQTFPDNYFFCGHVLVI